MSRETKGFSLTEIVVVALLAALVAALFVPAIARSREAARRIVCADSLRQIGHALGMYAKEHDGYLPGGPVSLKTVFSEAYAPAGFYPASVYVPWQLDAELITDSRTGEADPAFLNSFTEALNADTFAAWQFADEFGRVQTVSPLRQGINRYLITDANNQEAVEMADARVPVAFGVDLILPELLERPLPGTNVLYLDGHVEFERADPKSLTSVYPVSEAWIEVVRHEPARAALQSLVP